MSKAILVLDMPKDCPFCPLAHYNKIDEFTGCEIVNGKRYAIATEEGYAKSTERPKWCPIKLIPERKVLTVKVSDEDKYAISAYAEGWNDCIDEITGG